MDSRSPRRRAIARLGVAVALLGGPLATGLPVMAQHATDQVTITYWNGWSDPFSKSGVLKVIALFEKAHPSITVKEVDLQGSTADQKILTAITGGKPPDAATMFNIRDLGAWASRGAIQNLDALAKANNTHLADYTKAALDAATYKGHLYGLTIEMDSFALLVNTDLFRAAGLTSYPRTMSELAADAITLTKKDAAGRITQMGLLDGYSAYGSGLLGFIFPYFNVQWYDPVHNALTVNSAAAVQALTWEKNLLDKIGVQAYENFTHSKPRNPIGDFFIDGHVAMVLDGDWMCKTMPAYGPKVHWVAVAPPYADGHPEWQNSTWIDGGINIIPTGAAHTSEAYQFINFMNTTQANVLANTTIGGRSPLKSGGVIQAKQGNACVQLFNKLAQSKRAFPWPVLPMANDLQSQVGTAEDAVIRGQDTAQHALAQTQQKLQAELRAAH